MKNKLLFCMFVVRFFSSRIGTKKEKGKKKPRRNKYNLFAIQCACRFALTVGSVWVIS